MNTGCFWFTEQCEMYFLFFFDSK